MLIKALGVLLKLAPAELRTPDEYLDECYNQKLILKDMEREVLNANASLLDANLVDVSVKIPCSTCHASPETCAINEVGSEECHRRREDYMSQDLLKGEPKNEPSE